MLRINEQYVNETYDDNGVLTKFSLNIPEDFNFAYDIVDKLAQLSPNKAAMVWCNQKGEEHIFTFADMKKYSDKTANFLSGLGVKKGDMVLLLLKRHFEFWFTIVALHKLGAIAVPGTAMLTAKDLVYRFNAADIKTVVCTGDGETSAHVDEAQKQSPLLKNKVLVHGHKDGWYSFSDEVSKASEKFVRPQGDEAVNVRDHMIMFFTSGTTGEPKMVCHDFSYPLAHIITAKHWQHVLPDGLHLTVADTGWGKAVWGKLYGQWIMESTVFTYDFDKFDPRDLLSKMEKYKVTTFCAPPTVYRFFIKGGMEGFSLKSLKYATTAGEALNPEVFKRFREFTGLNIMEAFGQTESTVLIANLYGSVPRPGSLGRPSPLFKIDLLDKDGNRVPDGEVGEICVDAREGQQAGLFKEYYRDPKNTKKVWHNGYYHTRDTAKRDSDGYLWYVGRTDDVIKSSGYRIGPFEIESVLMEHPAVLECAITGAPDSVRGQIVKATIVLTKNYKPSDKLAQELKNFVKRQTAPYKYPRIIEFVKVLPKTISGKIRRVEIRQKSMQQVKVN